ncbi:MAG TPA: UDP-N-acetylmuramate--L-alanine ligase [Acidimicrobiia bacterium]|nr:UDP-N-acetylmuramate--L-alanine ligase [Acidimicrobiia bacterium]
MAELVDYRRIHMVGVAGSGMSGLAKMFAQAGHRVTGSDIKPAAVLRVLEGAGVETWVGHRPERAGEWDLVVASSAVPGADPELVAATDAGVPVWARPQLLDALTAGIRTVGVTGTHGKTTTTAMMVTALHALGRDPSFLVGGEMIDLNTSAHLGQESLLVLEADEAFGTFSGLDLAALAVTNIEADHLDHYQTLAALESAFRVVAGRVAGPVVACVDDPGVRSLMDAVPSVVGYGTSADATWRIEGIDHQRSAVTFTLAGPTGPVPVRVPKPGDHIASNATAVLALLGEMGLDVAAAADGLSRFGGVRRRFEIKGVFGDTLVVDDYAHHPTEVAATIAAASLGHRGEVIAVFQPHRYTRTAELGHELGLALAGADRVFVTDVYAAGEAPIPGVTGRRVADAAAGAGATVEYVPARQELASAVHQSVRPGALVLLLGAGDITLVADELVVLLADS